jgi:ubiquinone/menaquinone biosynthesis C-methylase UbiE
MGSCRAREETGVADRVTFFVSDASTLRRSGGYDLVTIFEALHDMSRPVEALRAIRRILSKRGFVVVADELVEPEFTHRHRPRDRYAYGWSVVSCLPGAMDDPHSAATGR